MQIRSHCTLGIDLQALPYHQTVHAPKISAYAVGLLPEVAQLLIDVQALHSDWMIVRSWYAANHVLQVTGKQLTLPFRENKALKMSVKDSLCK